MPVCVPTRECLVFHCVTCTSISRGLESRPLTNVPTVSNSSFCLNGLSSRHGVETLCSCSTFVFCRFAIFPRLSCPTMSFDQAIAFACVFSQPSNFSVAATKICYSNIFLYSSNPTFVRFTFALSASQIHMIKKRCRFSQITTCFIHFIHTGSRFCFFPANVMSSTYVETKRPCWTMHKISIPSSVLVFHPCPVEHFSNDVSLQ